MTFEIIFTPCGRAMRFVDYVTLELTARTARMLRAVYTRFNTLPPSLYTLANIYEVHE